MACARKYRGRWVVDWRDPSGKRFIEAVEDNTREAAKRRLAEILNSGEQSASKKSTFQDYANWWLENCVRGAIKESTYQEYVAILRNHVYPLFGSKSLVKVSQSRTMIRQLIAAKKKEGFSQQTIRNIIAPVRGMFFQAMEDGVVHKNPAARIGKLNKRSKDNPEKKINPLTREEIQTMLKVAMGKKYSHYYPLLLCAPRTGIRKGELISLKGIDLDFNGHFIHVQRNLSRGKISGTKNGKDRKVDMSSQLAEVLSGLLSRRRAEALRKEMEKPAEERRNAATVVNEVMEGWLFTTPAGAQIDPGSLLRLFYRLLVEAKLRRVRFHDLRHSFASLLLSQGESPAYVKDQMGHSSIQITVDIYGHLIPGGNRQAVDKLDDAAVNAREAVAR
jgi:integrase